MKLASVIDNKPTKKLSQLKLMQMKKRLVVLTGAGISAESGLRTFRDSDGLWEGYNIEDVATPRAWKKNPELVLDFYNYRRREVKKSQPNQAHYGLAKLQRAYDVQIITQNIDDLHERAGSENVLHLHGEIFKMCSELDKDEIKQVTGDIRLGDLTERGHQYRPYIVWFEESVPMIPKAIDIVSTADIFVVVGTSLQVYPAAGLLEYSPLTSRKFIIDTKIPYVQPSLAIEKIELPAGLGVSKLIEALNIHSSNDSNL